MKSLISLLIVGLLIACQPTVKVEAPDKPIVVDLNVNVKVQIDKDLDKAMKKNKDIF